MTELFKDPKILLYALLGGLVPAIFWLWFWFKQEDNEESEPKVLIAASFVIGGIMVIIAIWLEKYSLNFIKDNNAQVVIWATIEEVVKLAGVAIILLGTKIIRKPIDYPMYIIAVAVGFAAFENVLYLIRPLDTDGTVVGFLTGNLRFLGSTLLHAISSSMIGSALGLSFYIKGSKGIYLICGLFLATLLHSIFNFFIMKGSGENFLSVFGFLWVVAIINILIFEKLRRMGRYIPIA